MMLHILLTLSLGLSCAGCFLMAWAITGFEFTDDTLRERSRHPLVLRLVKKTQANVCHPGVYLPGAVAGVELDMKIGWLFPVAIFVGPWLCCCGLSRAVTESAENEIK